MNEILPVPTDWLRPIPVLLLVQLNVDIAVPLKLTIMACSAQTVIEAGVVNVGAAVTVSVTGVRVALTQPVAGSRVSA